MQGKSTYYKVEIILAGTPAKIILLSKDFVTTEFAPTITLFPSTTPSRINTLSPIQQLSPITISFSI